MAGTAPTPTPRPVLRRPAAGLWRLAAWTAVLLVLALVFVAYLQPAMALQLAQQLWACF